MRNPLKIDIPPNRIFGLEIIRGFGILAVVFIHGRNYIPASVRHLYNYFIPDVVTTFFVLSGYLIGRILIKDLQKNKGFGQSLIQFWKRRWLRTLPNYYFILILICTIHILFDPGFSFISNWTYFLFLQNMETQVKTDFFAVSWSLSIEEWFYLITPIALFFAKHFLRVPIKKNLLVTAISVIIFSTAIRYYRVLHLDIYDLGTLDYYVRGPVITRLDSTMFGILAAYISVFNAEFWTKYKIPALIIGLILLVITKIYEPYIFCFNETYNGVFYFTMTCVATAFILPFLSTFRLKSGVLYTIITKLSLISYALYLVHIAIVREWIIKKIDWNSIELISSKYIWILQLSLYWSLSLILSILLYKYFEWPILKLRDKNKQASNL